MSERPEQLDRLLDAALGHAVADETEMSDEAFHAGRQRLIAALSTKESPVTTTETKTETKVDNVTRRRRMPWVAAAAAVTVLVAGGVVLQTVDFTGDGARSTAQAAEALNRAAGLAANASDQPLGAGQYRYVRSRYQGITLVDDGRTAYHAGLLNELWIPGDVRQEWLERQVDDGAASWLPDKAGTGTPPGNAPSRNGEFRAPCGAFSYFAAGQPNRCEQAGWTNPTAEFLAALPSDPEALYRRLLADGGNGDAGVFSLVQGALSTGQVPAAARAQLYRALAHAPSLVVTDDRANLDGHSGMALGLRVGEDFVEIIIDPADGAFIGWREVVAEEHGKLAKGTVRQSTATTTGVADVIGSAPGR
jgi:hypothetical protein